MPIVNLIATDNQPLLDRFFRKVEKEQVSGCWNFMSSISREKGQGRFFYGGRSRDAYVFAYVLLKGPVPNGTELHHKRENRRCVNPEHLQPVTRKEHAALSPGNVGYENLRKTECPLGHPLVEGNLVACRKPVRVCLICARRRSRECQSRLRTARNHQVPEE